MAKSKIKQFQDIVWQHHRREGRHTLPWRRTQDPYKILVSEVMLQQTQAARVIPFYRKFIRKFPTARILAAAPLPRVLKAWQGLGYNRRAKYLHEAAKKFGKLPLADLPGIGPYTARAVEAFAYNKDVVFVETNIRTAVIHHFFPKKKKIPDMKIEEILAKALPKRKSREWYSALMDYGAHLKRSGVRLNTRSRHYTKQSSFKGSMRETRGAILRAYLARLPLGPLRRRFPDRYARALAALKQEGLIQKQKARRSAP